MAHPTSAKNKHQVLTQSKRRPPVVAVLGHVDHGKTTLLDQIRQTDVAAKEAGGITQHIGAYQIQHQGRKITFIDTPGHEAFSAMRARGGQAADVAVLVVAATDGVMPQTKESISHIRAAEIPLVVAINKVDLPTANIEKVKKQLSEADVLLEGYGGDVVAVPISAKTGQGVDELLEMILLVADLRELKEDKNAPLRGIVIESKKDKAKGVVATVIIKEGTLGIGDPVYTASIEGKVRSLTGGSGEKLSVAPPSTPVEILGFSSLPKIGEIVASESPAKIEEETHEKIDIREKIVPREGEVRLIIKADVAGSLEAITGAVESFKKEDSQVKIYYAEVGDITKGDVLLASATGSLLIGFNVGISGPVAKLAEEEKVLIRQYNLIYELLGELKEGLEALGKKEEAKMLGEATIVAIFNIDETKVVGAKVISGKINKNDTIVVKRGEKIIGKSKIISMKHRDTSISEAVEGEEFGVVLEQKVPFTKGDIMISIGRYVTN